MTLEFLSYPDNIPDKNGYYFVKYYNQEREEWLYKSLWYSDKYRKWLGPWKWSYDTETIVLTDENEGSILIPKGIEVEKFSPETWSLYYVPSMILAGDY